jgi:hypothetical protein
MRCHVLVLTVAHSVLGVCVVSYNKLHRRANATKLGSKIRTRSYPRVDAHLFRQ